MISVANAKILKTDVGGLPVGWIGFEDAAKHVATGEVAWSLGSVAVLRGGTSRSTSKRSVIEIPSIVAVHGEHGHRLLEREPAVTREKILRRDRNLCAFCGEIFRDRDLTIDHVMPVSRGGKSTWMNLVTACFDCNCKKKRNRTPEECGMPLLYLPYIPSIWEEMILKQKMILADQMEFLIAKVPRGSRLHG